MHITGSDTIVEVQSESI